MSTAIPGPLASPGPLVFISHDSRDEALAEAFSRLLASVSAGILKTFRSSDRRGQQGFEFGTEWYPELMARLTSACDVVCLLTEGSLDRPWILYEAGVAKGKLNVNVHGLALGVPLARASVGPFAQFHNCDSDIASIAKLVTQLLQRLPNADPDPETIAAQVEVFRMRVDAILAQRPSASGDPLDSHGAPTATLFEEIKVMFEELPARLEADGGSRRRARRPRVDAALVEEVLNLCSGTGQPCRATAALMCASLLRDDAPWLFAMAAELYRAALAGDLAVERRAYCAYMAAAEHVAMGAPGVVNREAQALLRQLPMLLHRFSPDSEDAVEPAA